MEREQVLPISDRMRRAIEGLPDGSSITLPVEVVREWLDAHGENEAEPALHRVGECRPSPDLTVAEIADREGIGVSTVRTMMPRVAGAYKLAGRWKCSLRDWCAYLDSLKEGEDSKELPGPIERDPETYEFPTRRVG